MAEARRNEQVIVAAKAATYKPYSTRSVAAESHDLQSLAGELETIAAKLGNIGSECESAIINC